MVAHPEKLLLAEGRQTDGAVIGGVQSSRHLRRGQNAQLGGRHGGVLLPDPFGHGIADGAEEGFIVHGGNVGGHAFGIHAHFAGVLGENHCLQGSPVCLGELGCNGGIQIFLRGLAHDLQIEIRLLFL